MIMQQPTSGPVPVSKVIPFIGLDQAFNAAVNHIAGRLWPMGFKAIPCTEIRDLDCLRRAMKRHGCMVVSSEYSDPELTIWGCRETNYAFRAWHDWHHLKLDAPFDLAGETAVANSQAGDLINLYGAATSRPGSPWRKLLEAEVIGQARYMDYHGQFPTDQKGFTLHYLGDQYTGMSKVFH
jgi:hypothetical protein